jgi:CBS-domain-containing membrane protein
MAVMIWINTHWRHSYQHFGAGLHNVEGANIMQAKEIMTLPVVSVEPNATILQAIRTMLQRRISGLPVIDKDSHLVGVVTEGDFLRRVETLGLARCKVRLESLRKASSPTASRLPPAASTSSRNLLMLKIARLRPEKIAD